MYLNMLCSLFFFGSHNFFSVFFSFLQRRSSSSTFLLSFDRISFDFLSIFSHFLYATGFTDQLLSLWFVCLAIFSHSAHSFAPSPSRALEIVPFRFSVFDKFTECAPTEYIFASQYFSFVRWMVCIYRACIYNAHPHRITFTMFDVCQRVFRSLALCEIFAHINCEPESHAFRFGSQLNNKKSSSWMMFWHKLPAEKKKRKIEKKENGIASQWILWLLVHLFGSDTKDCEQKGKRHPTSGAEQGKQRQRNGERGLNESPFSHLSVQIERKWIDYVLD